MKIRVLALAALLLSSAGAFSQKFESNLSSRITKGMTFKKHNFGVEVSTSLFDGSSSTFNPNLLWTLRGYTPNDLYPHINGHLSYYYSFGATYRYRFTPNYSLAAKFVYNFRNPEYYLAIEDCTSYGEADIYTFEVPVLFAYTLPVAPKTEWSVFAGVGITYTCMPSAYDRKVVIAPYYEEPGFHLSLHKTDDVSYTIQLGTSFAFEFLGRRMETSLLYKYCGQRYHYEHGLFLSVEDWVNGVISDLEKLNDFRHHTLEVQLSFFF